MRTTRQDLVLPTLFGALFTAMLSAGCKDSNTLTGNLAAAPPVTPTALSFASTPAATPRPPVPTPTPTPPPAAGLLSGAWTGFWETIDYKGSSGDCHSHVDASATLTQNGEEITGYLRINHDACWGGGEIRAQLVNGALTGHVLLPGYTGGALTGTATATEIHAIVEHLSHDNGNGTGSVAPGGALTLTR